MKKFFLLFALFAWLGGFAMAQTRVITGTVTSSTEGPIIGVSVTVAGTTIGTLTGVDGRYSISVPQNAASLTFTYIGMGRQEVQIEGRSVIDIVMESDIFGLDEVVVTALGISREKKALGYAVSEVRGDEMLRARGGVANPVNALQGKVAGLRITGSTGSLGGSSKIQIRGANSISSNNQPLFIVDGVPIEGSDYNSIETARGSGGFDYGNLIQDINPDDIENI